MTYTINYKFKDQMAAFEYDADSTPTDAEATKAAIRDSTRFGADPQTAISALTIISVIKHKP